MMNAIEWPQGYLPGYTDNFVTNEAIVAGLTAAEIWPFLAEAPRWPSYYANSANVRVHDGDGLTLALGRRFSFETFGVTIDAEVVEYAAPAGGEPGRVAWHGWGGEGDARLDAHHAWLVEDLDGGRVRILTQETQNGAPAKKMATTLPNPMLNGHQMWLDGLTAAARGTVGDGRQRSKGNSGIIHWNGLTTSWDCPRHGSSCPSDNQVVLPEALLPRAHEIAETLAALPILTISYTRICLTQKLRRIIDEGVGYGATR